MMSRFARFEEELTAYEAAIKKQIDYEAAMEQKYDEGIAVGEVRGEAKKARDIAKKLLKQNLEINLIAELTGLTIQQIKEIS